MHLNYHFLRFLCPELQRIFSGNSIQEVYSQKSGEFILCTEEGNTLRFYLSPPAAYFSFPENFQPAKKNRQNLFLGLLGQKIKTIKVLQFERSYFFLFESGDRLLFKLHGNRSNVLLYPTGSELPNQNYRKELKEDWGLSWETLEKNLDMSLGNFQELGGNASQFLPTLGPIPRAWLKERKYPESSISEKWGLMQELIDLLESPLYSIFEEGNQAKLSLLPVNNAIGSYGSPIQACNELYYLEVIKGSFDREKITFTKTLEDQIKKTSNYIQKTSKKLDELKNSSPPSNLADIVMANLHLFDNRSKEVSLWDFYENKEISLSLKPNQKPQDFAAQLYRKNKNRKIEWEQLEKTIQAKRDQLSALNKSLIELVQVDNQKELRKFTKLSEEAKELSKNKQGLPFRAFGLDGYKILVGKSSKDNDEMLRNHSKKNDLWLHARSVSGSHVIIKVHNLPEPPNQVIETAAQLAAYYSKNKSETLAPVIFTLCKYVRKVKGSPAGAVIVEKEKVLMVSPSSPEELFGKK